MDCYNCMYYKAGLTSNYCEITQSENYRIQKHCTLVNDDGKLNYDDEYIRYEYGERPADECQGKR